MHFKPAKVTAAVDAVIRSRKTVRAFRPEQVPRSQLVEVLEMARTAPSTFNTQPRRVYVLVGRAKQKLSEAILKHTLRTPTPALSLTEPRAAGLRRATSRLRPTLLHYAGRRPNGYGSAFASDRTQFCLLRCTRWPDFHDRCHANEAQLARLRSFHAELYPRSTSSRSCNLSTGLVGTLLVSYPRTVGAGSRGLGSLRNVARLCG